MDRPIIFSGPMVRALLEGRKTQTRRVLRRQPDFRGGVGDESDPTAWGWEDEYGDHVPVTAIRLPYAPGDRLWVRETFAVSGLGWGKPLGGSRVSKTHYRADPDHGWEPYWGRWKPSIHMPRWASRLTLVVTDVRVQRLREITPDDARAEGHLKSPHDYPQEVHDEAARDWFMDLWDSINAKRGYGWATNPWVAALTFTVHKANIDRMEP